MDWQDIKIIATLIGYMILVVMVVIWLLCGIVELCEWRKRKRLRKR